MVTSHFAWPGTDGTPFNIADKIDEWLTDATTDPLAGPSELLKPSERRSPTSSVSSLWVMPWMDVSQLHQSLDDRSDRGEGEPWSSSVS